MLAAAIWQLYIIKWLHCNNRTVGTMLAAAIWHLGQCLQLLYDSCTNGCIATTGQIWAMLAAALWQLRVAHDKRPTGANRSFSWANRSFAHKKWANEQKPMSEFPTLANNAPYFLDSFKNHLNNHLKLGLNSLENKDHFSLLSNCRWLFQVCWDEHVDDPEWLPALLQPHGAGCDWQHHHYW